MAHVQAYTPKVSIILTSYNHGPYLGEAIGSILNQTFEDFELIVWDDASTDNSWEIITSYTDSRIRAYRNDINIGPVHGVNKAIFEIARGQYIALHHSDDVWLPAKLQKQVEYLDQHPEFGAAFTYVQVIDEYGAPLQDVTNFYYSIFRQPNRTRWQWLRFFFFSGNALCHPSILIRKECYEQCGGYDERLAQLPDFDMWIRLLFKYDIHILQEELIRFRIRNNEVNTSGDRPDTRIRGSVEYLSLLGHYKKIHNFEELSAIFPEVQSLSHEDQGNLHFLLGKVALQGAKHPMGQLFALQLLHEALSGTSRRANIQKQYQFSCLDLNSLTSQYDVFGVEARKLLPTLQKTIAEQSSQFAKRSQQFDERYSQLAQRYSQLARRYSQLAERESLFVDQEKLMTTILGSTSWKITRPLRGIRYFMVQVIARKKAPVNLLRILRNQIRTYGLGGLLRRAPYYWYNRHRALGVAGSPSVGIDGGLFPSSPRISKDIRLHPDLLPGDKQLAASVSVVIPTLNAGPEFPVLLRKLLTQQGLEKLEVVIVDSGSTDETVQVARAAGCTVVEISPADFSHSFARNIGADAASGQYLLFMVQDAFPVGRYWAYGMLSYLQEHSGQKLAAVSCSEYSRSDSDMMYDSLIHTHYRFLGCLENDRIGEFRGDDHMSLRANGQLSDVACMVSKELFERYRYRGAYAEDLDFGIRLLKDGYRVGLLASVKVIHSHNRPAFYYLKRGAVDAVFLAQLLPDFSYPQIKAPLGLIAGIISVAAHLSGWRRNFETAAFSELLHVELAGYLASWRKQLRQLNLDQHQCCLDDGRLDSFVNSLAKRYLPSPVSLNQRKISAELEGFVASFLAHLENFNRFAANVYGHQDEILRRQLFEVIVKTFSATVGTSFAYMYLGSSAFSPQDRHMAETLFYELKEGI